MTKKSDSVNLPKYNPDVWKKCWVLKIFDTRTCLTCPMPECWYNSGYKKRWMEWDIIEKIGTTDTTSSGSTKRLASRMGVATSTVRYYRQLWEQCDGDKLRYVSGEINGR